MEINELETVQLERINDMENCFCEKNLQNGQNISQFKEENLKTNLFWCSYVQA